jgi:hypothetical protein
MTKPNSGYRIVEEVDEEVVWRISVGEDAILFMILRQIRARLKRTSVLKHIFTIAL